jgi:transcriptional regulator with XRE-family HTH domain
MPAPSPRIAATTAAELRDLGARLRTKRKELRLSAVTTAEAAGMSRVTLHRIERGEPSVAIGAYLSVVESLGLKLELSNPEDRPRLVLPENIRPRDYPQLKKLAWQLREDQELLPEEALAVYERNWRHLEPKKLDRKERALIKALLEAFGRKRPLV